MKLAKVRLALTLVASLSVTAIAGVKEAGGGDPCENQIKIIREDLASWIRKGGHAALTLPTGTTADQYSQSMLRQIEKAKVQCVGAGDRDYPVTVFGTAKVCKFEKSFTGTGTITCDRNGFLSRSESEQYVLVHHEYAGLSRIEVPTKDDSQYGVSNQITSFLANQVVKRLVVKNASSGVNSPWRRLNGAEGSNVARALQDVVASTKFVDCRVELENISTPANAVMCGGATYYYNRFHFIPLYKLSAGFSNIPVGDFTCDGNSSEAPTRHLMTSSVGGRTQYWNILDRNVAPESGEEKLHLRLDTVYELDATETKIEKVTITKSKVMNVNQGTIGNPAWADQLVPTRVTICNGSRN